MLKNLPTPKNIRNFQKTLRETAARLVGVRSLGKFAASIWALPLPLPLPVPLPIPNRNLPCKSAIEITLAQLGLGGYWLVLAIVMLFPVRARVSVRLS